MEAALGASPSPLVQVRLTRASIPHQHAQHIRKHAPLQHALPQPPSSLILDSTNIHTYAVV